MLGHFKKIVRVRFILITVVLFLVLPSVFLYISYKPTYISKQYNAVIIDIENEMLLSRTNVNIVGTFKPYIPVIRKKTIIANSRVSIDAIGFTMDQETYRMEDMVFSKYDSNNDYVIAQLVYACPYDVSSAFDGASDNEYVSLGPIMLKYLSFYADSTQINKFIISSNNKEYIVGPADTLEEAFAIYHQLLNIKH